MARELSYPVWRGPIVIGLIVICCFGWWWWKCPCVSTCKCDCPAYAEVVVDEGCVANPWEAEVSQDELVMWTNLMPTDTLRVTFTVDSPFAVDSFKVPPGHQTTLIVQNDADGEYSFRYFRKPPGGTEEDCTGGTGGPKVVVGGGGG